MNSSMKAMYFMFFILICLIVFSKTNIATISPAPLTEDHEIDSAKYKTGERIFRRNCSVCHGFERKMIGSPLNNIWRKYEPEWIYNYLSDDKAFSAIDSTASRINTIKEGEAVYPHNFKNEISRENLNTLLYFIKTRSEDNN